MVKKIPWNASNKRSVVGWVVARALTQRVKRLELTDSAPHVPEMLDLEKSSEPGGGALPLLARRDA